MQNQLHLGLSPCQKVWVSLMKLHGWPSTNAHDVHRCQRSSLVTQSLKAPPSTFPLVSLNTWRPRFTFPLTLPHCVVTLPKGTPLAWPCTGPPTHTYSWHTHKDTHACRGRLIRVAKAVHVILEWPPLPLLRPGNAPSWRMPRGPSLVRSCQWKRESGYAQLTGNLNVFN